MIIPEDKAETIGCIVEKLINAIAQVRRVKLQVEGRAILSDFCLLFQRLFKQSVMFSHVLWCLCVTNTIHASVASVMCCCVLGPAHCAILPMRGTLANFRHQLSSSDALILIGDTRHACAEPAPDVVSPHDLRLSGKE